MSFVGLQLHGRARSAADQNAVSVVAASLVTFYLPFQSMVI
jgi:hypothetical protein